MGFLSWSTAHIFSKVASIQGETGRVAFRHVEDFTKEEYVAYVEEAVNKPDSIASTTLYNYLLTLFVEADIECKGKNLTSSSMVSLRSPLHRRGISALHPQVEMLPQVGRCSTPWTTTNPAMSLSVSS